MNGQSKREIKFRVYDTFTKRMWHWGEHNAFDTGKGSIERWFTDHDLVQMQYTGLADVNDTDIYEGDILQHKSGRKKVVEWHNGRNFQGFAVSYEAPVVWEVIGNIYQNPELKP